MKYKVNTHTFGYMADTGEKVEVPQDVLVEDWKIDLKIEEEGYHFVCQQRSKFDPHFEIPNRKLVTVIRGPLVIGDTLLSNVSGMHMWMDGSCLVTTFSFEKTKKEAWED